MRDIWFISDTHFGHENCLRFKRTDGAPMRSFSCWEEMDETMIERWNARVKTGHRIWHLGDFALQHGKNSKRWNEIRYRLNGDIAITVGNHDKINEQFVRSFDKIELWRGFNEFNFTACHMPIRLDGLRDGAFCLHGHTHSNELADTHYINICVEMTGYAPVHLDEVVSMIESRT